MRTTAPKKRGWLSVGIFWLCVGLIMAPAGANSSNISGPTVRFTWKSHNEAFLKEQKALFSQQGADVREVEKTETALRSPMAVAWFVLAGAATVSMLAESLLKVVKDMQHGGLVIDGQGGELRIVENPALDRNQIVFRQPDGEIVPYEYEEDSEADLVALLEAAAQGLTAK